VPLFRQATHVFAFVQTKINSFTLKNLQVVLNANVLAVSIPTAEEKNKNPIEQFRK
jgi:hypothetical protein